MTNMKCSTAPERVQQAIVPFLEGTSHFHKLTRVNLGKLAKVDIKALGKIIPHDQWIRMKDEWLIERLRKRMDELFESASIRRDFTIGKVTQGIIREAKFNSLLGDEYRRRAAQLPTTVEAIQKKVLATLKKMVDANIPVAELTVALLYKESGYQRMIWYGPWLSEPLRIARLELSERQRNELEKEPEPPAGADIRVIPGGYIDLNSDVWDLKLRHGLMRRDRLHPNVAELAWSILREELRARTLALSTVRGHYVRFIAASNLLGTEVPDLRRAKLASVQKAWVSYEGTANQRMEMQYTLLKLVATLIKLAEDDKTLDTKELFSIAIWLGAELKVQKPRPEKNFLSEEELNRVTLCCFEDIEAGVEFMKNAPNLIMMSTRAGAENNALPVINWGLALIVLVMVVTGLRHQSVVNLKVNDWLQLRAGLIALAWRHAKTRQDTLAFMPTLVARLLDYYEQCTRELRQALGTERLILLGNYHGDFADSYCEQRVRVRMHEFAQRHNIIRNGSPIALTATILRRSYVTHQLYKGRDLSFVQKQLGHRHIETTSGYGQFNRYEHPAQVRNALDVWGGTLDLWRKPVLLENLTPASRAKLFEVVMPDQGEGAGGINPSDLNSGGELSPCATCVELIVNADSLEEWERQRLQREEHLRQTESDPRSQHLLADEREEFGQFKENYVLVKGRTRG